MREITEIGKIAQRKDLIDAMDFSLQQLYQLSNSPLPGFKDKPFLQTSSKRIAPLDATYITGCRGICWALQKSTQQFQAPVAASLLLTNQRLWNNRNDFAAAEPEWGFWFRDTEQKQVESLLLSLPSEELQKRAHEANLSIASGLCGWIELCYHCVKKGSQSSTQLWCIADILLQRIHCKSFHFHGAHSRPGLFTGWAGVVYTLSLLHHLVTSTEPTWYGILDLVQKSRIQQKQKPSKT